MPFALTPLYWCPHWSSLNEQKCETCQSEGDQVAYYRAAEVDELLTARAE